MTQHQTSAEEYSLQLIIFLLRSGGIWIKIPVAVSFVVTTHVSLDVMVVKQGSKKVFCLLKFCHY